ncbi:succinyl-diaminopimelate desuccinylase [Ruminococcus sp. YE71]|uniref:M20/M25/M40 family metallo-hydrolase n=1 Tax=unclassified Ruminococcus TaxID=2608920 RepID=UPI00087FDE18|nr:MULTISPECIES: M20/M25/M40 family metallo-hydrolase [unclassified Ruminococcus]SDA16850.1 succinyl-diaminopimelate desuccinylase [Ruminococcus sp. YE78]SFW25711.1 succinyl-diaminopimelate desuccinylase [Ruminococcus sp. YE71]
MTENDRQLKEKLEKYFNEHMDEILADLNDICSINSAFGEPSEGKPFGEGSAKALAWGAEKGKALGLEVKNFDNYAISMSSGADPVLGILSHLDTVPATDEGWSHPPFAATVDGDTIFGRGTIDDKGPSVAVLWAVRALQELNVPMTKNYRIIFGGNEEQGCEDIAYYEKLEAFPPMVFTPDGSFPVLNCEKGMMHMTFEAPFDSDDVTSLVSNKTINAIPDKCAVKIGGEEKLYTGKPAHASRPENGDNAVTKFLADYKGGSSLLNALAKMFPHGEYDGATVGLGFEDSISGKMTCALTCLNLEGEKLTCGIDIRFPIDRTLAEIRGIIVLALENAGFSLDSFTGGEPHYVPADSPFVRTLLEVYEDVKGEKGEPVAEGGVTYVHNTPGGVAFGAEFPWENNNMHGIDEHITLETFRYNLNMYANAIARICR